MKTIVIFCFAFVPVLALPAWGEEFCQRVGNECLMFESGSGLVGPVEPMNRKPFSYSSSPQTIISEPRHDSLCSQDHLLALLEQQAEFVPDALGLPDGGIEYHPRSEQALRERAKYYENQADKLKRQKALTEEVRKTLVECKK